MHFDKDAYGCYFAKWELCVSSVVPFFLSLPYSSVVKSTATFRITIYPADLIKRPGFGPANDCTNNTVTLRHPNNTHNTITRLSMVRWPMRRRDSHTKSKTPYVVQINEKSIQLSCDLIQQLFSFLRYLRSPYDYYRKRVIRNVIICIIVY